MKTLASSLLVAVAACSHTTDAPPAPPPAAPRQPLRDAVGDRDLRTMISDIATTKACALVAHQFRILRDKDRPDVANGVLWIRGCEIHNRGTQLVFELTGSGWTWAAQQQRKAGATFGVHQYVKFDVTAKLTGAIDVAYDRDTHIASLWFSPATVPDVKLVPIGEVEVDRDGLWAEILGALGGAVGQHPNEEGTKQAGTQGTRQMRHELSDGLSVTVDLCTGLPRIVLGRPPKGQMGAADAGETARVPVEMHPGGLMIFMPQLAPRGMSVAVDAKGPVHVGLVCQKEAEAAASSYLAGRDVAPVYLVEQLVTGATKLKVGAQACPVSVVARAAAGVDVVFSVARPAPEIARASGGPLVQCKR